MAFNFFNITFNDSSSFNYNGTEFDKISSLNKMLTYLNIILIIILGYFLFIGIIYRMGTISVLIKTDRPWDNNDNNNKTQAYSGHEKDFLESTLV